MKLSAIILSVVFLLICLAVPSTALESEVFAISEKTLSIDLPTSFTIVDDGEFNISENGLATQNYLINNTAAPGAAFISIMSVYDEVMSKMSPAALCEIFLIGGISAVESRGDVEIGNWTAVDGQGNNVTVHTLKTKDERIEQIGGTYDMAVWNLDRSTYAVTTSLLDRNNTTQMIRTLAIR